MIPDENQFIKAIDATKVQNWIEFEFLLSVLIENRLLRLYQADLEANYMNKMAELDQEEDLQA